MNGQIICDLGNLISGAGAVGLIDDVPGTVGMKTNITTVSAAQTDPNLANNRATVQTSVLLDFNVSLVGTLSDGKFYLYINGGAGSTIVVEASDDLSDPGAWTDIETLTLLNGVTILEYNDPANFEKRTYRVRLAP